ncbi:Aa_trans domain-containing protein [Durusdinium trenchii]|uniref:Aa_trans domain-containing protein n=1 Tax=Durusdinium trenchii TaxID=1381693 RepID=A0ABP0IRN6_9DINO
MLPTPGHGDRLAEPGERVASRESFSLEGEPEEKGLTLRQAVMISFNSGLSGTLGTVAYYPRLCGYWGFLLVLASMGTTAVLEQQALMAASVQRKAHTFDEMCEDLPTWARRVSVWSGVLFLWGCGGFCVQFIQEFISEQLCPVLCAHDGSFWLCQSKCYLSIPIFLVVFVTCYPSQLYGCLSLSVNAVSLATKVVLVLTAVLKGFLVWTRANPATVAHHTAWRPSGLPAVFGLLSACLANSGIMPQLAGDLKPSLRTMASKWCPIWAVALQASTCCLLALANYGALGDAVTFQYFTVYDQKYPDVLTSILQGGMAVVMILELPLVLLPCKSQVWGFMAAATGEERPLGTAKLPIRFGLNLWFTLSSSLIPAVVGWNAFNNFQVALTCTCGVWISIVLPALVLVYCVLLPRREAGGWDRPLLLLISWVLLLGVVCTIDGVHQLLELRAAPEGVPLWQECHNAAQGVPPKTAQMPQSLQSWGS